MASGVKNRRERDSRLLVFGLLPLFYSAWNSSPWDGSVHVMLGHPISDVLLPNTPAACLLGDSTSHQPEKQDQPPQVGCAQKGRGGGGNIAFQRKMCIAVMTVENTLRWLWRQLIGSQMAIRPLNQSTSWWFQKPRCWLHSNLTAC